MRCEVLARVVQGLQSLDAALAPTLPLSLTQVRREVLAKVQGLQSLDAARRKMFGQMFEKMEKLKSGAQVDGDGDGVRSVTMEANIYDVDARYLLTCLTCLLAYLLTCLLTYARHQVSHDGGRWQQ